MDYHLNDSYNEIFASKSTEYDHTISKHFHEHILTIFGNATRSETHQKQRYYQTYVFFVGKISYNTSHLKAFTHKLKGKLTQQQLLIAPYAHNVVCATRVF